ncbi:MAG: SDR family NAD(P)-dependent oxidoreductase [Candidatus Eisenbacteria bacterium]|nr:SDR family NAD(P)-dependent oxidoreductase [Candidatus Eisenbacteria bacterium]
MSQPSGSGAGRFLLSGRVALVTGGNGGLGRAIALGLREAGASVAVTGRDPAKNAAIAAELGGASRAFAVDVRDEEAVSQMIGGVVEQLGRLDILVCCAGDFAGGPALDLSLADWERVLGSHLTGTFLCAKHAAREMAKGGEGGKIVAIGSMYSLFGPPRYANYAAAKSGILGLTRALAVELAMHRIQVNAILPGWFETALTGTSRHTEWGERIRRKTPAARWGEPEDLVGAAIFLSSRASDFVTGVALPVDGGYAVADRLLPE